jgi:hypothetical protein
VDQGKGSARSLRLAGLTCHWLYISGFSPTPLVCLMPGKFGLRGRIARIRSGTSWLETVPEEPSMVRIPRKRVQAQILKCNQEEARADRARLLAAAENGRKISIMLEECALPYNVIPVNLSKGEQFKPEFLSISSDNRMPVMVGPDGPGGRSISIFGRVQSCNIWDATRVVLSARRARPRRGRSGGQDINQFPRLKWWLERVLAHPSIARYIFGSKRRDQRSPILLVVK